MRSIENEIKSDHWEKVAVDFKQHVVNPFETKTLNILYWMSNKWDKVFGKKGSKASPDDN